MQMERKIILENNSTQNRNIFKSDQNGIYYDMERNVNSRAREYFDRKPYAACGGSTLQKLQASMK